MNLALYKYNLLYNTRPNNICDKINALQYIMQYIGRACFFRAH